MLVNLAQDVGRGGGGGAGVGVVLCGSTAIDGREATLLEREEEDLKKKKKRRRRRKNSLAVPIIFLPSSIKTANSLCMKCWQISS